MSKNDCRGLEKIHLKSRALSLIVKYILNSQSTGVLFVD